MSSRVPLIVRLELGGLALGGMALAHWLGYLIAAPDPHERQHLLLATGHRFWPYLVALALGGMVMALSGVAARAARTSSTCPGALLRTRASFASRLALVQVLGFLLLEAIERMGVGAEVAEVITDPAVLAGLLMQFLVAVAGALLLVAVTAAVQRIFSRRSRPSAEAVFESWRATGTVRLALQPATGGGSLRGPPSPS